MPSKKKIILIIALFSLLIVGSVFSYGNKKTHPKLTQAITEFYNQRAERKLTDQQIEWMKQGSVKEDEPVIRCVNHYYDPINNIGLSDKIYEYVPNMAALDWANSSAAQSIAVFQGDYSWRTAIYNYQQGNYEKAFLSLGHVLHLLEDMAVPAHTRDDAHEEGDVYEKWAEDNDNRIGVNLDQTVWHNCTGNQECFKQLALYSNENFFSKDTINLDKPKVEIEYLYKNGIKIAFWDKNNNQYLLDNQVHKSYWDHLAPMAVGYGAGLIELFFEEAEGEKIAKPRTALESVVQKLKDTGAEIKNQIAGGWQSVIKSYQNFASDISSPLAGTTQTAPLKQATNIGGKVLSAIENPITAEDLFSPQKAKGGEDDGASASQLEQEKVKVLSSEYSEDQGSLKADSISRQDAGKIGVSYVIDGDTIILTTGEKVRYIGIDTPELNNEGAQDDECLAWAARLRNMELLGKGELKLIKDPAADKDQYGRLLRYVYSGDIFINEQLAREGLAEEFFCKAGWQNCPVTADQSRQEIIQKAVDSAEQNKCGLFSGVCEQEKMKDESENNKNKEIGAEQTQGGNSAAKSSSAGQASPFVFGIGSPAPSIVSQETEQPAAGGEEQTGEQPESGQSEDENSQFSFGEDEEEELEEEIEEITPIITWFNLYDLISSSTTRTTSATVGVDLKIENQEPVNGYFLSMSSTTPEISAGDWAASSSEYFILPEENGEKTVYLWLKYGEGNITDVTSSSIVLDIAAPAKIIKTAADYVVISEFATQGSGGAYDEWVELYNPTDQAVDLTGWKLQTRSASSTKEDWKSRVGDGGLLNSVPQKGYYLISAKDYSLSVIPDYRHPANWGLKDDGGHIRIIDNSNKEIDKVGYGEAVNPEGCAITAVLSGNGSFERKAVATSTTETMIFGGEHEWLGNSYDSDDNSQDFIVRDVSEPQNSYSPAEPRENVAIMPEIIPEEINDSEVQHICASSALTRPKTDLLGHLITQTLTADKSPYYFTGTVYLTGSKVLTIEPGVVIKFGGEYFYQWYMYPVIFLISGKIIAQGTEVNPIVFTSIYDDSYCGDSNGDGAATAPEPGSWGGFQILSGNNIFDHVVVKYGGADKRGLFSFYNKEGVNQITNSVFIDNLNDSRICSASSTKSLIVDNNFCY